MSESIQQPIQASPVSISNLQRYPEISVVESDARDEGFGFQIQVNLGATILYQGPSGLRFDAWSHGYCSGREDACAGIPDPAAIGELVEAAGDDARFMDAIANDITDGAWRGPDGLQAIANKLADRAVIVRAALAKLGRGDK